MKKFSKLLAVVLAIAVVICPMMSAVAFADGENSVTLESVANNKLVLTINSANGFMVTKATVAFTGDVCNFNVEDYTLVQGTKDEYNLPEVSFNKGEGTATFIVSSTDAATLDLYSQVKIGITVAEGDTVTLNNLQAASDKDDQGEPVDAALITFEGISEDGTLEAPIVVPTTPAHVHSYDENGKCSCGEYDPNFFVNFVPTYNPATTELKVTYTYPASSETTAPMRVLLANIKSSMDQGTTRTQEYVLVQNGKEFFSHSMASLGSGQYFLVSGLALIDCSKDTNVFIRFHWFEGGVEKTAETNAFEFNCNQLVLDGKINGAVSQGVIDAYSNLLNEWNKIDTDYSVDLTNIVPEQGYLGYTVSCSPKNGGLKVTYTYGDTFKTNVLTPAKNNGDRAIEYVAIMNDKVDSAFVSPMASIGSGQYVLISGFSTVDLNNIKFAIKVNSAALENGSVTTNAFTVNANDIIKADTTDFGVAYNAFLTAVAG